jgi:hypothetical protein
LDGEFSKNNFAGKIDVDDVNGKFSFDGQVSIEDDCKKFHFAASADKIHLHNLNLTEDYPEMDFSVKVLADFEGDRWDNMNGYLKVDSVTINNHDESYTLDSLYLFAENNSEENRVLIRSNIINGEIKGQYTLASLKNSFFKTIAPQMPVLSRGYENVDVRNENIFDYHIEIEPTDEITSILEIPWNIAEQVRIYGDYNDKTAEFQANVLVPRLTNGSMNINNMNLHVDNLHAIDINFGASTKLKKDSLFVQLGVSALNDTITTSLRWNNDQLDSNVFIGSMSAKTALFYLKDSLHTNTHIASSNLIVKDEHWQLKESHVSTNPKNIIVDGFGLEGIEQLITIDGVISEEITDSLDIRLDDISLDYISDFLPEETQLTFGGDVSGYASIKRVLRQPILTADVHGDNFMFNNSILGKVDATSEFDYDANSLKFRGTVVDDHSDTAAILIGNYFLSKDSLDIIGIAKDLDVRFLNYYLADMLLDVRGYATGKVHVYGITRAKTIAVDTKAYADKAEIGVGYLNTRYYFSDTIEVTKNIIRFPNIKVMDEDGNTGTVDGLMKHEYFKDIRFEININMNNMMVLNASKQESEIFYGKAYATGTVKIAGDEAKTNISCRAVTNRNTRVVIPIDSYYAASDNSFITFTSKDVEEYIEKEVRDSKPSSDLNLDFVLDITPEAEIQLLIDSHSGDMIRGTGNGNIRITYNVKNEDLKMYGTYVLAQGQYTFTFQNAIRKFFNIEEGSTISWSGDVMNAQINIKAYFQQTASLADILTATELANAGRTSVPVQCILNLTGSLMQPNIKFELNLPNSDEELNRALKNVVNTDEQINRQIVSLLVLGKFMSTDNVTTQIFNQNELYSVVSSTLSSQLNNMASQMFTNWNFGVNFRTSGEGESRTNEYEFNFLYTPNERIVLNGNVGYRDDALSESKVIGDFDLEYRLVRSGKLSAKAYTHTNDYREFKKSLTTQGVGLVFRESFNSLPELWQEWKQNAANAKVNREKRREANKLKREAKKEEKRKKREAKKKNKEIAVPPEEVVVTD